MEIARRIAEWLSAWPHRAAEPGLSDTELHRAEETFELTFPPLLREVLTLIHPIRRPVAPQPGIHQSPSTIPDWRLRDVERTRLLIDIPADGVLFDVEDEDNDFWWHAWGPRPETLPERMAVAERELARVPRLIPLMGHLYVAASDDSPVFSVIQTRVYLYAVSLADLGDDEARTAAIRSATWPVGTVPFWSELCAYASHRDTADPLGRLGSGGF
ncbi:hypothetical protein [Actinoplanes subglobosus]|uniref:Knr4/Smi1-like domain-containing protein n=1 Tax=Actinoplanes subglobosus TaxID=1547892 RepID=A0ABV8J5Q4_9ACTN